MGCKSEGDPERFLCRLFMAVNVDSRNMLIFPFPIEIYFPREKWNFFKPFDIAIHLLCLVSSDGHFPDDPDSGDERSSLSHVGRLVVLP